MKIKLISSIVLSSIMLAGCNSHYSEYSTPLVSTDFSHKALVEGKILGNLIAVDKNEIAAGALAQKKAMNPSVRKYAMWIHNDHAKNLQETLAVGQKIHVMPHEGSVAKTLARKGKKELATLNHLSGKAFDKGYIDAMVKGHTAVLALINEQLKISTNPLLVKHLELTRAHVSAHLQQAKAIAHQLAHA